MLQLAPLLLIAALLLVDCTRDGTTVGVGPKPELKPEEVVQLVMTALQHNDTPSKDAGIATTFRFASPENKEMTGPLERFTQMVKGPMYAPMIGFESVEYLPIDVRGDLAQQFVRLVTAEGTEAYYVFRLRRVSEGDHKDCWMTDAVGRLPGAPPPEATQPAAPEHRGPPRTKGMAV